MRAARVNDWDTLPSGHILDWTHYDNITRDYTNKINILI